MINVCFDRACRDAQRAASVEVGGEAKPAPRPDPIAEALTRLREATGRERALAFFELRWAVRKECLSPAPDALTLDAKALRQRAMASIKDRSHLLRRTLRAGTFGAEPPPGIEGAMLSPMLTSEQSHGLKLASALRSAASALSVATVPMVDPSDDSGSPSRGER